MKKVLIVDDAMFMRQILKQGLSQHGFEIVGEASNGEEAVKKYVALKPDVVLMDITMPVMDGIEAVKQIKGKDPKAKIIMCSAMGQEGMVKDAIVNGARDFIVKPFNIERVVSALQKLLGA